VGAVAYRNDDREAFEWLFIDALLGFFNFDAVLEQPFESLLRNSRSSVTVMIAVATFGPMSSTSSSAS